MAGMRGAVQNQVNRKAVFVNYENHIPNLECVHASEVQPVAIFFSRVFEKLFTFLLLLRKLLNIL